MEEDPEAVGFDSNGSLNLDEEGESKIHSLKSMVKFVVSVCVFSLVLAFCFSLFSLFSLFPHSFSVYFSTFLFSLLNHAMERKYMFLVCNGILFLLASCSVEDSFSQSDKFEHHLVGDDDHSVNSDLSAVAAIDGSSEEDEEQKQETAAEEEEVAENEEEEDEGCFTDEVEEEGRGSEEVVVSTEELNKKIEEFIRKMKEEMRIEAQRQLIAV